MTACINLFTHVLQHPGRESTQSDLSLLDIGAGHFARLEFATESVISHSFSREVAQLARLMVTKAAPTIQRDRTTASMVTNDLHQPVQPAPVSDVNDQHTGLSDEVSATSS